MCAVSARVAGVARSSSGRVRRVVVVADARRRLPRSDGRGRGRRAAPGLRCHVHVHVADVPATTRHLRTYDAVSYSTVSIYCRFVAVRNVISTSLTIHIKRERMALLVQVCRLSHLSVCLSVCRSVRPESALWQNG